MSSSTPATRATVLWLMPAEPARSAAREIIAALAKKYLAPIFEPHITLGFANPEALENFVARPIELHVDGFYFTDQFTKNFFIRFFASADLLALLHSLGLSATGYDPHLSLLYGYLRHATQRELAAALKLPFTSVAFDSVRAVSCPNPTQTNADVASWKVIAEVSLTNS